LAARASWLGWSLPNRRAWSFSANETALQMLDRAPCVGGERKAVAGELDCTDQVARAVPREMAKSIPSTLLHRPAPTRWQIIYQRQSATESKKMTYCEGLCPKLSQSRGRSVVACVSIQLSHWPCPVQVRQAD
jgi:hypothetical protein